MLLRMFRGSVTGGPSPLLRLVAALLLVGMLALNAPLLVSAVGWVVNLL